MTVSAGGDTFSITGHKGHSSGSLARSPHARLQGLPGGGAYRRGSDTQTLHQVAGYVGRYHARGDAVGVCLLMRPTQREG